VRNIENVREMILTIANGADTLVEGNATHAGRTTQRGDEMLAATTNGITVTTPDAKRNCDTIRWSWYPNGLGIEGYDRKSRERFATLDCGSRISVVITSRNGVRRIADVTETKSHFAAYEIARLTAVKCDD
jgi:hypothetical protein